MKDKIGSFHLEPWEHIAGCSIGTWTDRESVLAMIDTMKQAKDDPVGLASRFYLETERLYRELAECTDDDIDIDWFTSEFESAMDEYLPPSCCFEWNDNEYRVTPYIDDQIECMEDRPTDDEGRDINPDGLDELYVVNDHGNVTYYTWDLAKREWTCQWGMV